MPETPEHEFLSAEFLEIVRTLSRSELYGVTESERRRFDFECVFQRDWSRPLVGQTLWTHVAGVDKDIRSLLTNTDAHIWAYIVRDNVRNRALVHEVVRDFRTSGYADQLFKLKVLWVPNDFDADREHDRLTVSESLRASVAADILFKVVFGRLTASDVRFFLSATGLYGLNLAVLHSIAVDGFVNYRDLRNRLGVSAGPLRERILTLLGSGFLWAVNRGLLYFVTLKGRVFLELLSKLPADRDRPIIWPELRYILRLLEIDAPAMNDHTSGTASPWHWNARGTYNLLHQAIGAAVEEWDIDLQRKDFKIHPWESDPRYHVDR